MRILRDFTARQLVKFQDDFPNRYIKLRMFIDKNCELELSLESTVGNKVLSISLPRNGKDMGCATYSEIHGDEIRVIDTVVF